MNRNSMLLEPKMLGFWIRCIRQAQHISQEALAASAGVDIRTVQRMEAGNPVNIMSRRSLARALGYEKPDVFDDPQFAIQVRGFLENVQAINEKAIERQHPDCIRLTAERVRNGETLGRVADSANALSFHADDQLSPEAKEASAAMFDYIRDLLDIKDDASFTDKHHFNQSLETILRELEDMGAAVYCSYRSVKMTNDRWVDKTPLSLHISYLVVVPEDRILEEVLAPRQARLG
jgi:transcriptional regulator with XRE-family HTH domain